MIVYPESFDDIGISAQEIFPMILFDFVNQKHKPFVCSELAS